MNVQSIISHPDGWRPWAMLKPPMPQDPHRFPKSHILHQSKLPLIGSQRTKVNEMLVVAFAFLVAFEQDRVSALVICRDAFFRAVDDAISKCCCRLDPPAVRMSVLVLHELFI